LVFARKALSPDAVPAIGSAMVLAGVAFDKRITTPLGVLSLDGLTALILAGGMWALRRAAPRSAPWAAGAFLAAALHTLAVARLGVPDVRVPLVVGFMTCAAVARELAPMTWVRTLGVVAAVVLAAAYAVGATPFAGDGPRSLATYSAYGAQLGLVVLVAVAASLLRARQPR
jgi:hypothetical protein